MAIQTVPFWKKIPALRVLLPVIIGIWLQEGYGFSVASLWWGISISFCLGVVIQFLPDYLKFRWATVSGLLLSFLFGCMGALATLFADIRHHPQWLGRQKPGESILVSLLESPVPREKTWKAVAEVLATVHHNGKTTGLKGRIFLYFSRADMDSFTATGCQPGRLLLIHQPPEIIASPVNPGQFNFQRYALYQGITHQAFLRRGSYYLLSTSRSAPVRKFLENTRARIISIIQKYIPDRQAAGLAEALLIGYKEDLDKDLLQEYADTGVVHIIAISGLHLGIIYWILQWCTRRMPRKGNLRWIRFAIILISLWLFSLLAGAQPSVLRSAVMFSFILAGESIHRRTNIYNTLCCSALFLLFYHPFWLWDIGFQLSYAAVLSLVLYMQPLYRLFYIQYKWLDYLWQMNAVTLAAQVLTIPLCLYHFHQFPNYFLLANLVCVPLSSALLTGAILLCIVSGFSWLAAGIGWCLEKGIRIMNAFVSGIRQIPYAVSDNIPMNDVQALLWYLILIGLMSLLLWQHRRSLHLVIAALLVLCIMSYLERQQVRHRIEWRVYHLPGHPASHFVAGNRYLPFPDSAELHEGYRFHVRAARVGLKKQPASAFPNLQQTRASIRFAGKKILILQQPLRQKLQTDADVLWLQKGSRLYTDDPFSGAHIRQVLVDGSLPLWQSDAWKKAAAAAGIPFHDVKTDGAFALQCR